MSEGTVITRVRINIKTGEVVEREVIGTSPDPVDWTPLVEALYEDIKKHYGIATE